MTAPYTWPSLPKEIPYPHVTFYYNGGKVDATAKKIIDECIDFIGENATVKGDAYGNDGKNEGIAVEICSGCKIPYYGAETPHITISLAEGAKAVDTAFLNFSRINFTPFIITGKIGFFMEDGTIAYSIEEVFGKGNVVYIGIFFDKEELYSMSTPEDMIRYSMEQIARMEYKENMAEFTYKVIHHIINEQTTNIGHHTTVSNVMEVIEKIDPLFIFKGVKTWIIPGKGGHQIICTTNVDWHVGWIKKGQYEISFYQSCIEFAD
jgi:hypothetical protein